MTSMFNKKQTSPSVSPNTPQDFGFGSGEWAPVGTPAQEPASTDSYFGGDNAYSTGGSSYDTSAVATRNVLNSDVKVVGVLRFTDDLLVDGTVQGEIESEGVLTVGVNAVIEAGDSNKVAVSTRSAIIHGQVTGDVVVTDRVELASTAQLVGNVTAAKIAIQDGAVFHGFCKIGTPTGTSLAAAPATKKGKASTAAASDNLLD